MKKYENRRQTFRTNELRTSIDTGRIGKIVKNPDKERNKNERQLETFDKLDCLMSKMLETQ